jgi:hypothetical protein
VWKCIYSLYKLSLVQFIVLRNKQNKIKSKNKKKVRLYEWRQECNEKEIVEQRGKVGSI